MKKFKIIKNYPDSRVNVGDILEYRNNGYYTANDYNFYFNPELFPEFFEKVEELEYEILEFLDDDKRVCVVKGTKVYYSNGIESRYTIEEWCKSKTPSIHKIKRLSDSQEFQIGDKVCWDWTANRTGYYTIKSFEINNEVFKTKIAFTVNELETVVYMKLLHDTDYNFRLYKEPIYITADNHKIYEYGEKVHWVTNYNDGKDVRYLYDTPLCKNHLCVLVEKSQYKVFHDKSKALEYVESENKKNKVLFTTFDGVDIKSGDTYYYIVDHPLLDYSWTPILHIADWFNVGLINKPPLGFIQFSTRELAQEYINKVKEEELLNSKCLSYNDVNRLSWSVEFLNSNEENKFKQLLKELIKSKQ